MQHASSIMICHTIGVVQCTGWQNITNTSLTDQLWPLQVLPKPWSHPYESSTCAAPATYARSSSAVCVLLALGSGTPSLGLRQCYIKDISLISHFLLLYIYIYINHTVTIVVSISCSGLQGSKVLRADACKSLLNLFLAAAAESREFFELPLDFKSKIQHLFSTRLSHYSRPGRWRHHHQLHQQ